MEKKEETKSTLSNNLMADGKGRRSAPNALMRRLTVISTFGGLLFGYDTGVINGALSYMAQPDQLNLNAYTEGLVASSLLFGAALGSIAGGFFSDKHGRRKHILYLAVLFFITTLGCTFAPDVSVMVGFRFLLGLAVGGASVAVPTYLAEMSPAEIRGRIVTQNELMIVTGQFLAFVFNAMIGVTLGHDAGVWRYMLVIASLPAVVLWAGMLVMPESPRWLVSKGRIGDALGILQKVREEQRAQAELKEIQLTVEEERKNRKSIVQNLLTPWIRRILFLGLLLGLPSRLPQLTLLCITERKFSEMRDSVQGRP